MSPCLHRAGLRQILIFGRVFEVAIDGLRQGLLRNLHLLGLHLQPLVGRQLELRLHVQRHREIERLPRLQVRLLQVHLGNRLELVLPDRPLEPLGQQVVAQTVQDLLVILAADHLQRRAPGTEPLDLTVFGIHRQRLVIFPLDLLRGELHFQ
jgi:hypothetical protein